MAFRLLGLRRAVWNIATRFTRNMECRPCTLISVSLPILLAANIKNTPHVNTEEKQERPLSHSYLVKNASSIAVDAVCSLINQTVSALVHAESQYATAIYTLIRLMDYKADIKGNTQEEEKLWDLIIEQKATVYDSKQEKLNLEQTMMSVEKLAAATAETAFAAGADSLAIMLNEHLQSATLQLETHKKVTKDAERHLVDAMTKDIETTTEDPADSS